MSCRCVRWRVGTDCLRVEALVQVWTSDALGEDWELERAVDAAQGGSRTVRLRGPDGIVDIVVSSFLGDLMQPLPPCGAAECFEMDDDAALEVSDPRRCIFE